MKYLVAIPDPNTEIHVDVKAIPAHVAENFAQATLEAVRRALKDPAFQADYEKWKAERG